MDGSSTASYHMISLAGWLRMRLLFVSVTLIGTVALLLVLLRSVDCIALACDMRFAQASHSVNVCCGELLGYWRFYMGILCVQVCA